MTRIISGVAKGRRLAVPDAEVRPTSDRVREAIFSSLQALVSDFSREDVLDLFAGTGALGLEALSRGARSAVFVERSGVVAQVLRNNLRKVGCGGEVLQTNAMEMGQPAVPGASLVFLDPPYETPPHEVAQLLIRLHERDWFSTDAIVILEGPTTWSDWRWPGGFEARRHRKYGQTCVWYGTVTSDTVDER